MPLWPRVHSALRLFAALAATLFTLVGARDARAFDHADPRVKHESWRWSGTLASGRTVEINGVNGDVLVEPGTGDKVEVTADKAGLKQDPAKVSIKVVEDSDGITICSVYPGTGNPCAHSPHWGFGWHENDVEVEYHVRIPAGARFAANTVNGGVVAKGIAGGVRARTVNGAVDIEGGGGDVRANTVNGSIRANLDHLAAGGELSFKTVNGSITLGLPEDANADFEASTVNGGVHTDFPVTVSGDWGPRRMHGTLGKGGARLHAATVNGAISLKRTGKKGAAKSS